MKASKIIRKVKKTLLPTKGVKYSITPVKVFYVWDKNTLTKVETFII